MSEHNKNYVITQIGITAGEIWHFLDREGATSLEELCSGIDHPRELVLMSLGWLAREGHVLVLQDTGGYRIDLRK